MRPRKPSPRRATATLPPASPAPTITTRSGPTVLGIGEEGDVGAAGGSHRVLQQGNDQLRNLAGLQPWTKTGMSPLQHLGVNRAGADADGSDAMGLAFNGDGFGEADHAVLRDVVGSKSGELLGGVNSGQGSDIDDASFTRAAHGGEGGSAAEERAGQVHRDRLLPCTATGVLEGLSGQDPCGADQRGWRPDTP